MNTTGNGQPGVNIIEQNSRGRYAVRLNGRVVRSTTSRGLHKLRTLSTDQLEEVINGTRNSEGELQAEAEEAERQRADDRLDDEEQTTIDMNEMLNSSAINGGPVLEEERRVQVIGVLSEPEDEQDEALLMDSSDNDNDPW